MGRLACVHRPHKLSQPRLAGYWTVKRSSPHGWGMRSLEAALCESSPASGRLVGGARKPAHLSLRVSLSPSGSRCHRAATEPVTGAPREQRGQLRMQALGTVKSQ